MNSVMTLSIFAILYLCAVAYLGFRGYKATQTTADYLVAGRKAHPVVMALSYGATFISTSAIVGFGGAAAVFGMGVLWLTVLNIFVGIFIAFVVFGKRTRRMGVHLQAHTFPELLGRRFNSRFIQGACALIILVFMPLYASAVLIGIARYIESTFTVDFAVAVTVSSLVVAAYVIAGGLKGVMYTDALQGGIMFVGMVVLIFYTYAQLGGVVDAHKKLDAIPADTAAQWEAALPEVRAAAPDGLDDAALLGWFAGVAEELKKTAAMDDAQKAAFFEKLPEAKAVGGILKAHPELVNQLVIAKLAKGGFQGWTRMPKKGSPMLYTLITSLIMGVGLGVLAQPQLAVRFMTVKSDQELHRAVLVGSVFILSMTGVAFTAGALSNAWFIMPEHGGKVALASVPGGNIDSIIPAFINGALPKWFGLLFMLTLLSAAMSTLSSQFHTMGTAIGRDFFEKGLMGSKGGAGTVLVTRLGIVLGLVATVMLCFVLPEGIIAAATAIFFGLCAAAFLPAYVGALFWKGMTKAGAIASVCAGFFFGFFWIMFIQMPKAQLPALLSNYLLGKPTLLPEPIFGIHWNWVEALFVALPLSAVVAVVVSLATKREPDEHLALCFGGIGRKDPK